MTEEKETVQRVVRGGATMYPQENPRPTPLPFSEVLGNFLIPGIRAPILAVLVTKLLQPSYEKWVKQYLSNGGSDVGVFVRGTTGVHTAVYFGMYLFFEIGGRTEWMHQYQLPRTAAQEPTWGMKLKTLGEFTANALLQYFIISPTGYKLFKKFGMPDATSPLPSALKMFFHFSFSYYFNIIIFACVHRLFHHGPLYRMFHKKHHEYVGTITIAAENAHPVEAVLANVSPTLGGCLLTGAHPLVLFVWLAWRLEQTLEAHSGYCFYGTWLHKIGLTHANATAFHDHHHTSNKGSFGCEFMDWCFGTMDAWLALGGAEGYVKLAREQHAREKALKQKKIEA